MNRNVYILGILIVLLALVAAGGGLFWQGGEPVEITTLRGDAVQIEGGGLYRYDSISGAAQERGNDLVTLIIGVPLLITGLVLASRGSLRGRLLLAGSLGFFLYTYASMCFLTAFNAFFLVYVALFSMSLWSFILVLMSLDPVEIDGRAARFPRRAVSIFMFVVGAFLSLAWLGLVGPASLNGGTPAGLDSYTTMVIQALDLGVIVPLAFLTGLLLWQRRPWGTLLGLVLLFKMLTMGAALISMIIMQLIAGIAVDPVVSSIFVIICLSGITLSLVGLRSVEEGESSTWATRAVAAS